MRRRVVYWDEHLDSLVVAEAKREHRSVSGMVAVLVRDALGKEGDEALSGAGGAGSDAPATVASVPEQPGSASGGPESATASAPAPVSVPSKEVPSGSSSVRSTGREGDA